MKDSFRIVEPFLLQPPVVDFENLPQEMRSLASEISRKEDQQMALKYAYDTLSRKYRGFRFLTFLRLDRFFITDLSTLWRITGFLHCHHLNYLLRTLLITSGKFSSEDIRSPWTHIWYCSPHQYIRVKLEDGTTISVDLWGKAYGISFGSHAHGFQAGSLTTSTRN